MKVSIDATETAFSFSSRTPMFNWPYLGTFGVFIRPYDVSAEGRFLAIKTGGTEDASSPRIIVVQNWFEEVQRLVPTE